MLTKEQKERKIKIAMLIILCKIEAMRKDKAFLSPIRYAVEIAMWTAEMVKVSRIKTI